MAMGRSSISRQRKTRQKSYRPVLETLEDRLAPSVYTVNSTGDTGVTLTSSTLTGNQGQYAGGGIENFGNLTLTSSTLSGYFTSLTLTNGGLGGGLYNSVQEASGDRATVTGSTFNGNYSQYGGAIENVSGPLAIINSTISGNSANEGFEHCCLRLGLRHL
jgi:hypothetical protein